MEEGLEPCSRVLLQAQLPLPHRGVEEVEEQVPQLSGAEPRAVEDYKRRDTTRVHALHGVSIPGTHQCQTHWIELIHRVDQAR